MPWSSKTHLARFDFVTPLDAAAKSAVQRYLTRLVHDIDGVREYEVTSLRRLARGQLRADVQLRLEAENREVIKKQHIRSQLDTLIGSARYMTVRGVPAPLIRLYRTRLVS
ncbi:hypothetical protein KQI52_15085 [bacterium]|nr:hypothetical protein [bacterium]